MQRTSFRPTFRANLEMLEDRATPAVSISPIAGLQTSELGGYNIVNVRLTTAPTANVVIKLASDNVYEGRVSATQLVFTPSNWSTVQSFRVIGQEDGVRDGDKTYHVITTAISTDPHYNGIPVSDVTLINKDSRRLAGFYVSPTSGLVTTESGGTASFTVRLSLAPSANVTVPLSSSDVTEGRVAPATLVFTPTNWNVAQTVRVIGQDDFIIDGDKAYTIILHPALSADFKYAGKVGHGVSVVNKDNDSLHIFDGSYTGVYSGRLTFNGMVSPTAGSVAFSVSNGVITVTSPASGTGKILPSGQTTFGSVFAGVGRGTFSGFFSKSGSAINASGGWTVNASTPYGTVVGNGSWSAHRV
jgi:hypothetical protein